MNLGGGCSILFSYGRISDFGAGANKRSAPADFTVPRYLSRPAFGPMTVAVPPTSLFSKVLRAVSHILCDAATGRQSGEIDRIRSIETEENSRVKNENSEIYDYRAR